MSFTAKLEKVRFVSRERGQDRVGVLFSSSLPRFSKASLSGCRPGWDVCGSGPNFWVFFFFLTPRPPKSVEMCPDIHRCRSTLQGSVGPAPFTLTFHQPLEKTHKLQDKKVPRVYTWLPTPPGDYSSFPQSDRDQGQDKVTPFLSRK